TGLMLRRRGCPTPCVYAPNEVGEILVNIDTLVTNHFPDLAEQFLGPAAPNAFTVHGDDAPTFYLAKKAPAAVSSTRPTRSPVPSSAPSPTSPPSIPTPASLMRSSCGWRTRSA